MRSDALEQRQYEESGPPAQRQKVGYSSTGSSGSSFSVASDECKPRWLVAVVQL